MKKLAILSVFALGATPALAGSLDEPVVAPAPVMAAPLLSVFTGGYVGAQLGYGWGEANGWDGEGSLGGLHAGYLTNSGPIIFGGEVDYDWADVDFDDDVGSIDEIARLKIIAGYDYGRWMLYGTAGAAWASGEMVGNDADDWGWVGGVGAKYMVADNWSVGSELLYHRWDDFDDSGIDTDLTTLTAKVSYHF